MTKISKTILDHHRHNSGFAGKLALLLAILVVLVIVVFHVYLAFFAPPPRRDRTIHRNQYASFPVVFNDDSSAVDILMNPVVLARTIVATIETTAEQRNAAANELFSLPELPEGIVGDLARMFRSPDEDEVWRDYCLQFLGSALERSDGVTDEDRALARETLVKALASTNATFAGTALRALHRGDPSDSLVVSNALRIARDPSYSAPSRTTALLILEECVPATSSTLAETAASVSADPTASPVLRQAADAIRRRHAVSAPEN